MEHFHLSSFSFLFHGLFLQLQILKLEKLFGLEKFIHLQLEQHMDLEAIVFFNFSKVDSDL